ncbi:MAG: methyltransferase domain-containing protein [Nanoarchaeota archaeon]
MSKNNSKTIFNLFYHSVGGVLIFMNYFRHNLFGYRTPRTFSSEDIDRVLDYDFGVVRGWLKYYVKFFSESVKDKVIFELGPGPDLGIGLILLAMGAKKYIAIDVHSLLNQTPAIFYSKLFKRIEAEFPSVDIKSLQSELTKCLSGQGERLRHVVDPKFSLLKINEKVDIVFSQAAFEHFDDVPVVIQELGKILNNGGCLIALIDLKTHTGWIRDKDPLNIYRYSDWYWNTFKFKGSPNRLRSFEYVELIRKNDWSDVKIEPMKTLDVDKVKRIKPSLSKRFRDLEINELSFLSVMFLAKR